MLKICQSFNTSNMRNYLPKTISGLILIACISSGMVADGQTINAEYEKFHASDDLYIQSGMAMSPDMQFMAIAGTQSFPLSVFDISNRKVIRQFDVGNWYAGSRVSWSAAGRYLLLQQLFYLDFAKNKDREVNFEIVDAQSGQRVLRLEKYHDVKISPDEKYAVALNGNALEFWNLGSRQKDRTMNIPGNATNSLAMSPDGQYIAVSERPGDDFLNSDPQFRKNKKGRKFTQKYKQVVTVYRAAGFSKVTTINEYYDNIYRLEWSSDGRFIFCLNIPHTKATTAVSGRQNFISVIDGATLEPTRTVFPSNSNFEPDFRMSHNGRLMGVVSWGKFPEIRVHDFETGVVLHRFEMGSRLMEGIRKLEFPSDGRVFIEFMPGDKSILATFGNQLLLWNIPQDEQQ